MLILLEKIESQIEPDTSNNRPERRYFNLREYRSNSRATNPINNIKNNGAIRGISRDIHGKKLPPSKIRLMYRLRKLQRRASLSESKERNLALAISELDRISSRIHVSSMVREEAIKIYRMALDKGLVRGRSINALADASLYAACRLTCTPRSLDDLSQEGLVSLKELARAYRFIHEELNLEVPVPDPRTRIPSIAARVNASPLAESRAVEILTVAKKAKATSGFHPAGLAAAAFYIACRSCGDDVIQESIAEASGVTQVTLRNRYKKLEKFNG
jgi:transcription initiation factor TFIIB